MKKYFSTLIQLEKELEKVAQSTSNILDRCRLSINIINNIILEIRTRVVSEGFKDQEDEIYFFKKLKPKYFSQLLFFSKVMDIECNRPIILMEAEEKFLNNELFKIQKFFDENRIFYNYYISGGTNHDKMYFTSGNESIIKFMYSSVLFENPKFLSIHDMTVASILSNQRLVKYLKNEINSLTTGINKNNITSLKWTVDKVALVELIYALHSASVFNNGKAEVSEIKKFFEESLNLELGNIYRTFIEIQSRKENQVRFMNELTDGLQKRIEEREI